MDEDRRNWLWQQSYRTYYEAHFNEVKSGKMTKRWNRIDETTSFFVALTATSSAIGSWAIWGLEPWNYLWSSLISLAAILAIAHKGFSASTKLKSWNHCHSAFRTVRRKLEHIRERMLYLETVDFDEIDIEYQQLRDEFYQAEDAIPNDIFDTRRIGFDASEEVSHYVSDRYSDILDTSKGDENGED